MSYARTSYTGPLKNRGVDAQGRAKVSREELADFKAQYGQDKTLRDLLNADRTGQLPSSAKPVEAGRGAKFGETKKSEVQNDEGKARGPQGANLLPRQEQRYPGKRESSEDESGRLRSRRADDDSMRYRGQRSYVAKPEEPAGPTAEQLARYEEMSRPGRDAIEPIIPEAALLGAPAAARGLAGMARGAMTPKAAKEVARPRRIDPTEFPERAPRDLVSEANRRMRAADEEGFKKGGAVRSRGNGCARKGFGKGTMR